MDPFRMERDAMTLKYACYGSFARVVFEREARNSVAIAPTNPCDTF